MLSDASVNIRNEIAHRFEVMDGWIIYYAPTPLATVERISLWGSLLKEHVTQIRANGKEPVLLLNLEEVKEAAGRDVRRALVDGLKENQLKFIAAFGIKNPLMRIIFKFIIKASTGISGKAFPSKTSALDFLKTLNVLP